MVSKYTDIDVFSILKQFYLNLLDILPNTGGYDQLSIVFLQIFEHSI